MGSCKPAQDAGVGNTQCHGRRKCWFTRRVSKISLCFPSFLETTKTPTVASDGDPKRYEAQQTDIPHGPGIKLRCPFEYRVSMRSNFSFARDHEAHLANEGTPGAKPSKLLNPIQPRGQRHLPSSHLGRVGKRDPP